MSIALSLFLPVVLLGAGPLMLPALHLMPSAFAVEPQSPAADLSPKFLDTLIEPGVSVGPLKIGDSQSRALQLFPRKDEDQQWEDPCGTTFDWVDATNPMGRGDLSIRLKKGKVFQIESATTRFHTAEDITTFDSPEKVEQSYKDLRAFTLLTPPAPSLGDRPLVFWIDKKKGIAFSFAYDPSQRKRYLYKVIVFGPNKEFCPEQEKTSSPKWEEIPQYSVEPPSALSPESSSP
ncbi:MAG TPA: hypothetical protein VMG31_06680 [Verrucomicrobiae bacterium]|nr:hypothetical protein [Verrucomicrobiae bacterium]